jgi:hypothetical protein
MKLVVKCCVYFGMLCLIVSVIFRLIGEGYVVPVIRVSAPSMLNFSSAVFLMAIALGVAELVNGSPKS